MFNKMLIPLDGSTTAEKVLPYARALGGALKIPVELLAVVDLAEMATHITAAKARFLDTMVEDAERSCDEYLKKVAARAKDVAIRCHVAKGDTADVIIEKGAAESNTLITMATHGRSGLNRWMLGSIAEKVLRGTETPTLLVRAREEINPEDKVELKTLIVPLDGSELAETILPVVIDLAKKVNLAVVLIRAFHVPAGTYAGVEDYYAVNYEEIRGGLNDEAVEYLEKKTEELKHKGVANVSFVAPEGYAADEIIALGRKTPDSFIAMSTHGRSGVKRWVLGSVTETVVRHAEEPVLVMRPK